MSDDILPESRMKRRIGGVRGPDGTMIPIFCANCGAPCGRVPEKFITFTFALCDPCSEKVGDLAHLYKEPDTVFWKRVHEAQLEDMKKRTGVARPLTAQELVVQMDDPTSVIGKLKEEWEKHILKVG